MLGAYSLVLICVAALFFKHYVSLAIVWHHSTLLPSLLVSSVSFGSVHPWLCWPGHGVVGVSVPLLLYRFFSNPDRSTASVNFLDGTKIEQQRILLAVYPLL